MSDYPQAHRSIDPLTTNPHEQTLLHQQYDRQIAAANANRTPDPLNLNRYPYSGDRSRGTTIAVRVIAAIIAVLVLKSAITDAMHGNTANLSLIVMAVLGIGGSLLALGFALMLLGYLKRHPVLLVLAAAGCAWLMYHSFQSGAYTLGIPSTPARAHVKPHR